MDAVAASKPRARTRSLSLPGRFDPAGAIAWAVPFMLVLYLALSNGGYDVVERSEVGIALWWLLLVGVAFGTFTIARGSALAPVAIGLVLAYAAWTAISLGWSGSDERTMIELSRVATFVAALLAAMTAQAAGRWRAVLGGLTCAVGLVLGLAVLSRMLPETFPEQTAGEAFPGVGLEARLAYPLNYSSGLAALAVMGIPLLWRAAAEARTIPLQALAGGMLPIAAFALWLTGSSLTIPLLAVGVLTYLLLAPDRLPKLLTLLCGAAGAAVLVISSERRDAFDSGVVNPASIAEGKDVLVIAILVLAGVAMLQTAIAFAVRHGNRPRALVIPRRNALAATAVAAVLGLVVFAFSPAPDAIRDGWDDFTGESQVAVGDSSRAAQILDVSSRGRSAFWTSAVDAFEAEPWQGIGPGTFEFWWAQNGDKTEFVRDAHSLYLENLAELGIPGGALIGGFALAGRDRRRVPRLHARRRNGAARSPRPPPAPPSSRSAPALDWMWELGALALVFAALAGVALAAEGRGSRPPRAPGMGIAARVGFGAVALAALAVIAIPLGGAAAIDRSRDAAIAGQVPDALTAADDAAAIQPYAATPDLQRALLLESQGRFAEGAAAARAATEEEPENWRLWLTLSRLEAEAGNAKAAVAAYREARDLNPRSVIFAQ